MFHQLDATTRRHLPLLDRGVRARVRAWLVWLAQPAPTLAWRRGRNAHAAALAAALARGRLPPPFDGLPPDEPPGAQLPLATAVAAGLGRRRSKAPPPRCVPGTRLRLPAATRVPLTLDAAVADLAPLQVELAAALGAARERAVELEGRLADAETRLAAATAASAARQDVSAALGKTAARLQARVDVVVAAGGAERARPATAVATPRPPTVATPRRSRQPTPAPQPSPTQPVDVAGLRARIAALSGGGV